MLLAIGMTGAVGCVQIADLNFTLASPRFYGLYMSRWPVVLFSGAAASIASIALTAPVSAAVGRLDLWLFGFIFPLVEELFKGLALWLLTRSNIVLDRQGFLLFGLGFGFIDAHVRIGKLLASLSSLGDVDLILRFFSVQSPLMLHALCALVILVVSRRSSLASGIAASFALHSAYNAHSILFFRGISRSEFVASSAISMALMVVVLAVFWRLAGASRSEVSKSRAGLINPSL